MILGPAFGSEEQRKSSWDDHQVILENFTVDFYKPSWSISRIRNSKVGKFEKIYFYYNPILYNNILHICYVFKKNNIFSFYFSNSFLELTRSNAHLDDHLPSFSLSPRISKLWVLRSSSDNLPTLSHLFRNSCWWANQDTSNELRKGFSLNHSSGGH